MKSSTIKMMAAFAVAGLFSANVALAKNGNSNGNHGALSLNFGGAAGNSGNNNSHNNSGHCNSGHCNSGGYGGGGYCNSGYNNGQNTTNAGQAFEPFHSNYVVQPGDTFFEVSLKEYATSANARFIAQFNGLPQSAALTPGQIIQLPSISVAGQLSPSRAPIADALQGTAATNNVASFTPGTSSLSNVGSAVSSLGSSVTSATGSIGNLVNNTVSTPAVEAPRPKVTVGSTLLVDGQSFGAPQGAARLRVGGAALKIEVIEWTASSVKIRLPQLDLDSTMKADIEVVRADGSLASKTPIELGASSVVALAR